MARGETGCEVLHQDFLALDLPRARFDGIFANASLFHVPSRELPRVLRDLAASLKPDGVLFSSNPRGRNEEGWAGGRYGCFHDLATWRAYVTAAGFRELRHYYRPPGRPRGRTAVARHGLAQNPWEEQGTETLSFPRWRWVLEPSRFGREGSPGRVQARARPRTRRRDRSAGGRPALPRGSFVRRADRHEGRERRVDRAPMVR